MTFWDNYWNNRSLKRILIEFLRRFYFAKVFSRSVHHFCIKKNSFILEAGCGSGIYSKELSEMGYFVVGIDRSIEAINIARYNCSRVVLGDIFSLPFKDDSFLILFNQGVMEHFSKQEFEKILREFKRVAQEVLIIVPSILSIFRIYDFIGDDPHKHFFSRKELEEIFKKYFTYAKVKYLVSTGFLSIVGYGKSLKT